ncbi:MAG: FlgD immunoglobulin-like domain containing protein, partial [Elusimicrobiota bacterium]
ETGYKDTAVKPSFGTTSTTFYFRVQYINYHNLPPKLGYPKLHIKDYTGLIFSSTMTIVVSSNTAYSEGVVYALPVKNMGLGINYSYLLECQDVTGAAAAGVAAKYYHGPEVMVLVNVSTASAVVNWPDGTIISVPKLAFSTASYVAVGIPETIPPVLYDTGRKETGVIKNVVFDNTIVTPNAKIKLQVPFTSQDVNGLDPAGLVLCWYNSTNGEWVPIINSRSLYPLDNKVEADITVSGLYRLFEYESGAELLPPAVKVTNYPNPLVIGGPGSGKTAIRYSLPEDSGVEVKIYDLSGRLVREWKIQVGNSGAFAGNHSVEWDGKNDAGNYVTAGGYICIVKTKKGVAKTKIAVQ